MTKLPELGAFLSASWYAWHLERRAQRREQGHKDGQPKYHPDHTVVNVTYGVALTGFWAGVRVVILGPPAGLGAVQAARWAFWRMCLMFVTTAAPIWAVELWQQGRRVRALSADLREAPHAGPQAERAAR